MPVNPQIGLIASGLYAASLALGIPSLAATLFFGWNALRLWMLGVPKDSGPSRSPDQLIRLIEDGARAIGAAAKLAAAAGQTVITILAIVSLALLVFSAALFFVARGLRAGQPWARVVAGAMMAIVLLIPALALLSTRGAPGRTAAAMITAAGAYALWTLWRA
jgi:hypothetical protein